jgi:hypothetical protein
MHKVGTTSTGMIIVEMSKEQFDALSKICAPSKPHAKQESSEAASMSFAEKVEFVKPRIIKLRPKKTDSLKHGIKTMFNFTGGISDEETDKIVSKLERDKVISISSTKKVTYC